MAMVDLAMRMREVEDRACDPSRGKLSRDTLIRLGDIAGRQQLSHSYLEQILARLRRAGLVYAARGPGGGYGLARAAAAITIADIIAAVDELAVDERINAAPCAIGRAGRADESGPAAGCESPQTHDLWRELGHQITLFLQGVTLADVTMGRVIGRAVRLPRRQAAQWERDALPRRQRNTAPPPGGT